MSDKSKQGHRKFCDVCGIDSRDSPVESKVADAIYRCADCKIHVEYTDYMVPAEVANLTEQLARLRDVVEHVAELAQEDCPLCTLSEGLHEDFCGMSRLLPGDVDPEALEPEKVSNMQPTSDLRWETLTERTGTDDRPNPEGPYVKNWNPRLIQRWVCEDGGEEWRYIEKVHVNTTGADNLRPETLTNRFEILDAQDSEARRKGKRRFL